MGVGKVVGSRFRDGVSVRVYAALWVDVANEVGDGKTKVGVGVTVFFISGARGLTVYVSDLTGKKVVVSGAHPQKNITPNKIRTGRMA